MLLNTNNAVKSQNKTVSHKFSCKLQVICLTPNLLFTTNSLRIRCLTSKITFELPQTLEVINYTHMFLKIERYIKILIAVVIIGMAAFFGYKHIDSWYNSKIDSAVEKERQHWRVKDEVLQEELVRLQGKLAEQKETFISDEKITDVFGEGAELTYPVQVKIDCKELERRITAFFEYLDKEEYITAYQPDRQTLNLFKKMVAQITGPLPIITGETRDILTLLRNMAHFYRILGKKRIKLIKTVLKNESDVMEPVLATFFAYLFKGNHCSNNIIAYLPLEVSYTYAGFFLNTLSGRSYLFRRDSNIRILLSYYSVLVLDRANDEKTNIYGIDIRPYINFSMFDIVNRKGLMYQDQYLSKLVSLKKKYQM